MKWKKYTIITTTAAEDFVSTMLWEAGVEGVLIEDNIPLTPAEKERMFIDILPDLPPDKGVAYVSFFLNANEDHNVLLKEVENGLIELRQAIPVGDGQIITAETEDKDWINNWKQYFTSFWVDDIFIKPTWEKIENMPDSPCIIQIDPGVSFGTGKHETTQLCIRQLRKYLKAGDSVLDVGFGSGILSMIALKLGAVSVTGTDVDPACLDAVAENMQINELTVTPSNFYQGNLIDDPSLREKVGHDYDIVLANILADIVIPLSPIIPALIKPGGIYITSGIIDFKEQAVTAALEQSAFDILSTTRQGEWVSITARKR
jgi:ribosomal protein L11 methyltransferase